MNRILRGNPLSAEGAFYIGQEQDEVDGKFQQQQAFSGQISQVQLWNRPLRDEEIAVKSDCGELDIENGEIINWNLDNDWILNKVRAQRVSYSDEFLPIVRRLNKATFHWNNCALETRWTTRCLI